MPRELTVGPVVGAVTSTTARILIEHPERTEVVCTLRSGSHSATARVETLPNRPVALVVEGLEPGQTYAVTLEGASSPVPCEVRTPAEDLQALNVGAVSCNGGFDTSLWGRLHDQYIDGTSGRIDLLLHLGDQIYGDEAFQEAVAKIGKTGADLRRPQKRLKSWIEEQYRKVYRRRWGTDARTRRVLARTSNLMIWDDHEIRDDWGSEESDRDPDSLAWFIGSCARRVYWEYQRQLVADVPDSERAPEHHFHDWGPFGVMFLDQRGGRSFLHDLRRPYLGERQWADVVAALAEDGQFRDVRALIVVTSVPLAYLGPATTSKHGTSAKDPYNDLRDHWSFQDHSKEQIEMIRALNRWQAGHPQREVLVLGGDVHVGGQSEILHQGRPILRQLVTSPISNVPIGFWAEKGLNLLLEWEQSLGESYSFEHGWFSRKRNFGFVMLRHDPAQGTLIRPSLVWDT